MPGLSLSNGLLLLLPVYIFAHCNKPEPKKSWKGTHQSSGKKRECVQDSFLPGIDLTFGTEDCLVLNVYTPVVVKNSSTLLPVLFFIHGGGFQTGSGTNMVGLGFDQYDPSLFMDQEIVVITINYRLGALGFLTTEDEVIPANLGLRDQSLALKWVQENIDMFGGDPKDIVISGESAGAASVCHLLLSNVPEMEAVTAGIMTSGTCLSPFGLNMDAREKAFDVGRKLGYHFSENNSASLLKLLQSVPVEILFNVTRSRYLPFKSDDGSIPMKWSPVYAKDFYPIGPMTEAVDQGRFQKVPLLFGLNSEECVSPLYMYFLPQIKQKAKIWDRDISKMIQVNLNVHDRYKAAEDMKAIYTNSSFYKDLAAMIKYCTDEQFALPMGRHAEAASKYGVPVYLYILDFKALPHFIPGIEGVGHGEDMLLYWDTIITKAANVLFADYRLVSKRMVRLMSNFVKYKKPVLRQEEIFQNLAWPKFQSEGLMYMKIDTHMEVLSDPRNYSTKRRIWEKHLQKPISVY